MNENPQYRAYALTSCEKSGLALYGTVTELFSACVTLAQIGEPTGIPIILRSMYEAHVDLENLLDDADYLDHIQAANCEQTIKIMESGPLRKAFKEDRNEEYEQLRTQLAELKANGKGPLKIRQRCERAGRLDEYNSLYALFCLDTHSNLAALAERHLSETSERRVVVSMFGPYEPGSVTRRLDFGLQFLFEAARDIHGAFEQPAPQIDELAAQLQRIIDTCVNDLQLVQ